MFISVSSSQVSHFPQPLEFGVVVVEDPGEFCQQTRGFFLIMFLTSAMHIQKHLVTKECGCLFKQGNELYHAILHDGGFWLVHQNFPSRKNGSCQCCQVWLFPTKVAILESLWQVGSLSSFKVSSQLLTNDLTQVLSISLLMTSSTLTSEPFHAKFQVQK